MKPLVSILIPAYNAEKWIASTIESALAQTWLDKEIIVVDDGSTDHTRAIARNFESASLKVISQENSGASAARNCALNLAQGDFIQYLDADDLLAADKIERQLNLLLLENLDCIVAGEWARFYQTPSEALFIPELNWVDMSPIDWLICVWENNLMMHPAAWLVPRQLAQLSGAWNENLSLNDDGEYFCRVILASKKVKFCWGAKSFYRSGNSNSLSGSKSRQAWESAFYAILLSTENFLAKEDSDRTHHACATAFQRFIYEVYPEVPDLIAQAQAKVQQFGGSSLQFEGGLMFKLLSTLVGWQQAKRLKKIAYTYGYNKITLGWKLSMLRKKLTYRFNPKM
ncbi:MAG: glycosyltransferase [Crinalium sp.]